MDDGKEHLTLEFETELCSDSLGWMGGKIHGHLSSSAGRADETKGAGEARNSVA